MCKALILRELLQHVWNWSHKYNGPKSVGMSYQLNCQLIACASWRSGEWNRSVLIHILFLFFPPEELLQLHRGQGMDIYWRDCYICPTEDEYRMMVCKSRQLSWACCVSILLYCQMLNCYWKSCYNMPCFCGFVSLLLC